MGARARVCARRTRDASAQSAVAAAAPRQAGADGWHGDGRCRRRGTQCMSERIAVAAAAANANANAATTIATDAANAGGRWWRRELAFARSLLTLRCTASNSAARWAPSWKGRRHVSCSGVTGTGPSTGAGAGTGATAGTAAAAGAAAATATTTATLALGALVRLARSRRKGGRGGRAGEGHLPSSTRRRLRARRTRRALAPARTIARFAP